MDQTTEDLKFNSLKRDARLSYPSAPSPETIHILGHELATGLIEEGLLSTDYGDAELSNWVKLAFRIAHKFSRFPFTLQKEILEELDLEIGQLKRLNAALRKSDLVQRIICDFGETRKYWHNTIIPTVQSEGFSAVLNRRHMYPFRVGLFPGMSCMFECSFCGRNYDARYETEERFSGNEAFRSMMREAPTSDPDRFYFSGGLEPLTNPEIGSLISYSRELDFKTSMYTNGYMLTPKYLAKNQGIWELDALRLSLYGLDEPSAVAVTGKRGSYDRVIDNVTNYLQLKKDVQSNTKFGINFVILPQNIDSLFKLANLVCDLNKKNDRQGVAFITLREDFSILPEEGIATDDRNRMLAIFEEFEYQVGAGASSNVEIDYGYALQSIRDGFEGRPLEMVGDGELRGDGYPQISVVIDLRGDVYIYREAGFLDRPGAARYIIGRVTPDRDLPAVVAEFIDSGYKVPIELGDWKYLDAFDHVIVKLLNQAESDRNIGIPFNLGPVRDRTIASDESVEKIHLTLAHPTLSRA